MRPSASAAVRPRSAILLFTWLVSRPAWGARPRLRSSAGPDSRLEASLEQTSVEELEFDAASRAVLRSRCEDSSRAPTLVLPRVDEDNSSTLSIRDRFARRFSSANDDLSKAVDPCGIFGSKDSRLQNVEHVDDVTQDFEKRMKPPFVSIPGQEDSGRVTKQQARGIEGIFDTNPEDFRDCVLMHMYGEPLEVVDAMETADTRYGRISTVVESPDGKEEEVEVGEDVVCKPGSVFDDTTTDEDGAREVHVSTEMYARLEGISNPVQIIPHGQMSTWKSLWKVPLAGFLCMSNGQSDSAPVLYATPTPCVPTTNDAEGNALDPTGDSFEVWIGSSRLAFPNKTAAEELCLGFVEEVAQNLEVVNWDIENVRNYFMRVPLSDSAGQTPNEAGSMVGDASDGVAAGTTAAPQADTQAGRVPAREGSKAAETPLAPKATAGKTPMAPNATAEIAPVTPNAAAGKTPPTANAAPTANASLVSPSSAAAAVRSSVGAGAAGAPGDSPDVDTEGMNNMLTPMSPSLPQFLKLAAEKGNPPKGWTKGQKKLLVVMMDWKQGDKSLKPFSQQMKNAIPLYQKNILPKVAQALNKMSYGQLKVVPTIIPEVVRYNHPRNKMTGKLPFPTLYERARDAVQGGKWGKKFKFKDFHLAFVIHPQVNPVGTKGVAWVGSRGAIGNGLETVSDAHKVMVMVHELGHNLGLAHASSDTLDYGNVFDWMGNSPEVQGLSYGLGYVLELGWLPRDRVLKVTDKTVNGVNDVVTLVPFDQKMPGKGKIAGVQISLSKNPEDIYVSFRNSVAGKHRGVYITYQDKKSPNSRLMDAGCHTQSQQDAHLNKGMLFMDKSQSVVVSVVDVQQGFAKVHVWKTPNKAENIALIRQRAGFTDGRTKCPPTCQDSDLIMSYTCQELKKKGYCGKVAKLTINGKKLVISTELCPQTCGKCKEVLSRPAEVGGDTCADRAVKISGMDCEGIAKKDACGMKTTAGKFVGRDFCPKSCGHCPKAPPPPAKGAGWQTDPKPVRTVGFFEEERAEVHFLDSERAEVAEEEDARHAEVAVPAPAPPKPAPASEAGVPCEDDPLWRDVDGNSCQVYANSIASMGMEKTCNEYNGGVAFQRCRKTCNSCQGKDGHCVDNVCIEDWMDKYGLCYSCADFSKMCTDPDTKDLFARECPLTCGVCGNESAALDADDIGFHYNSTTRNFADSVLYCESKGKVIASIRSEDEQRQAQGLVKGPTYIGGASDGKGEWSWVDGSPWIYENPGNDGLLGKSETKLAMSSTGEWHDVSGEDKFGVLCRDQTPVCMDEDKKHCEDLGLDYCSNKQFAAKCRRTCQLCWDSAPARQDCEDSFDEYTCMRYKTYGWCDRPDTKGQVRQNCKLTCAACDADESKGVLGRMAKLRKKLCDKAEKANSVAPLPATQQASRALRNYYYAKQWAKSWFRSSAPGAGGRLAFTLLLALAACSH